MKDYSVLKGMIENQKSELRTAYDKGYNQCVKDFNLILEASKKEEEGYNRGLESAWSCAKRIISMPLSDQEKIFNMQDERAIMDAHSADEAIDIIKRYDEKQNSIERCCKNCKHSEKGMVGSTERCKSCYYDGVSKANTLFEPMETDNSKIEVGDVCRYQTCERIFIITSIHEGFGGEEYFDAIYSNGEAIKNGKLSVIEKINGECVDKLENIFSALINICISGKADE